MKIAFVTGIKFLEWGGECYATTFSSDAIRDRYLSVFGELAVFARAYPGDAQTPRTMVRSSGNGVEFHFQASAPRPADFWLKRGALRQELEAFLSSRDGAIIRLPSNLGLLACGICDRLRKPYLVESVGCPWDSLWNHSWKGKLLAPSTFLRTRRYIRNASHVVYTSREFLQRRYPTGGKSTHCSNVALAEFDPEILRRRREKIAARTASAVIGSCGQIDLPFKGHRFVVEALARLNRQGGDFRYELVGAGNPDYILGLARRFGVADRVRVLGKKSRADVFRWLDSIDLYVQPSLTEGLSRALVEAMSRAVPSLGSATGGNPEFLGPRCLFRNKSVDALVETLKFVDAHRLEISEEVYERSREYAAEIIEARRKMMFLDFREWVEAWSGGVH